MRRTAKVGLAASAIVVLAGVPALADLQPQPGDVVGVGGDTVQYQGDFFSDGDPSGDPGYNTLGNKNRVASIDATADANGRASYVNGTSTNLNPTVVLRAGNSPVQRPQSSGDSVNALLADTGSPETINFVRSASAPTGKQQATATTNGWGGLRVVEIGTDSVSIAVSNTTNAPSGLSVAELKNIYEGNTAGTSTDGKDYTHWNGFVTGGSSDAVIPLLPPDTSSITKTLYTALGITAANLGANVKRVEQNDPSALSTATNPADAIVPFSANRLALYGSGYFLNPSTVFPGGATIAPGAKLLTATAPDSTAAWQGAITLYIVFRASDATSTQPFEPGGKHNWAQELFITPPDGSTPWVNTGNGKLDIASAGGTPVYHDLGNYSVG
jgi:hypothetical protein